MSKNPTKQVSFGRKISILRYIHGCGLGCLLLMAASCSNDTSLLETSSGSPLSEDMALQSDVDNIKVDVTDFIVNSGIEPRFPQVWIFDKTGEIVSTELSFSLDGLLNIEQGKSGPVAGAVEKLEVYLATKGMAFDSWRQCGTDYCVVLLVPDASFGECPPCGMMQSRLEGYFSERGADTTTHSIILVKPSV